MRKDSYESILSAVGRVLDLAEARGFAIREVGDGLHVDTFDVEGKPLYTFQFGLSDLAELLDWHGTQDDTASFTRGITADEGTLAQVLGRGSRELVGTYR